MNNLKLNSQYAWVISLQRDQIMDCNMLLKTLRLLEDPRLTPGKAIRIYQTTGDTQSRLEGRQYLNIVNIMENLEYFKQKGLTQKGTSCSRVLVHTKLPMPLHMLRPTAQAKGARTAVDDITFQECARVSGVSRAWTKRMTLAPLVQRIFFREPWTTS